MKRKQRASQLERLFLQHNGTLLKLQPVMFPGSCQHRVASCDTKWLLLGGCGHAHA
jgi:hypothetical protein